MKKELIIKVCICVFTLSLYLYSYLEAHNEMTKLRLELPKISSQLRGIEEENLRLKYEVETFESPQNLLALMKTDQFSHYKFPQDHHVWELTQGIALQQQPASPHFVWEKPLLPRAVFGAK